MVFRSRVLAVPLAALLALALLPSVAWAATAPVYDVQIWPGAEPSMPQQTVLIVGCRIPTDTALPAKIRIPVPEGFQVTWAGELLGGDGSGDIVRETTTVAGTTGGAVEMTVEKSRNVQIEGFWKPLTAESGGRLGAVFDWVQTVPADVVDFSVRFPAMASDIKVEPGPARAPEQNAAGETLYTLPSAPMRPGDAKTVKISYSTSPAGTGSKPAGSGVTTQTLLVVLGVGALALGAVAVYLVRRERAVAPLDDFADDSDEE